MKKLASSLFFGKDSRASGLIALAIVGAIALGCTCNKEFGDLGKSDSPDAPDRPTANRSTDEPVAKSDASEGEVPSDREAQEIARTTLLDFNEAIQKGDFEDF